MGGWKDRWVRIGGGGGGGDGGHFTHTLSAGARLRAFLLLLHLFKIIYIVSWHFSSPCRVLFLVFITLLLSIQSIYLFHSSSSLFISLLSSFHHCFPYLIPTSHSAAHKHWAFPLGNENLVLFRPNLSSLLFMTYWC